MSTSSIPRPLSSNTISSSSSSSSSTAKRTDQWMGTIDKRLGRTIDFLLVIIMVLSLFTAIIIAIIRNELFEQCPLYAKLYLRDEATQFSIDTIDQHTEWGSVYTCEFASFAYLSAFVLSFISLWIRIVFRRVTRTERLLRLPIGLLALISTLIGFIATSIVTDGVIKFCSTSEANICSSSGAITFSRSRWKIYILVAGGWLTTLSILLNVVVRGIQLFSKSKKLPETSKSSPNRLMTYQQQQKVEKGTSDYDSQTSKRSQEKKFSQSLRQHAIDQSYNREFSPELYPYYYPPVPQYRQIEKRSRFYRICSSCFRRRDHHRHRHRRSFHESYQPFVIPEEYFHRLNYLKQNGVLPINLCHRHSLHRPVEQQTQTDLIAREESIDTTNEMPVFERRRSSVRFEDETPLGNISNGKTSISTKTESVSNVDNENEKTVTTASENQLERSVSFRNNEDDLWTTVTINTEQSVPVQSSHFNRLSLENLSIVDTSMLNNDNGVTAVHVNNKPTELTPSESAEEDISSPLKSSFEMQQNRSTTHRYRSPSLKPLPSHVTSSEDEHDLRHIKPVEEINALVTDKYNYNNLSRALKSNVERLKKTFIHAQENQIYCKEPQIITTILSHRSSQNSNTDNHSSDC